MGFMISAHTLPTLQNWERCDNWFLGTSQPKRNWDANERPLRDSRSRHLKLVQRSDSYELKLYNTTLVGHFRDGHVEINPHDSMSSRAFIGRAVPHGLIALISAGDGHYFFRVTCPSGTDKWYPATKTTLFKRVGRYFEIVTPPDERKRWVLNKVKAAAVRRQLKPFTDWHKATTKIAGPIGRFESAQASVKHYIATHGVDDPKHWMSLAEMASLETVRAAAYRAFDAYDVVTVGFDEPPTRAPFPCP